MTANASRPHDSFADLADDFAALASEPRLEIVLALATAGDRDRSDDGLTAPDRYDGVPKAAPDHHVLEFAELKRRTSIRDGGRFSYHLDRLRPGFVESVGGGYRLTAAGAAVAATIVDRNDSPADGTPVDDRSERSSTGNLPLPHTR